MIRWALALALILLISGCATTSGSQNAASEAEAGAQAAGQTEALAAEKQDSMKARAERKAQRKARKARKAKKRQEQIAAAINHPDRPAADFDRDAQRKPAEVLAFFNGIRPGDTVFDIFTGGGWYAEIQSRIVGSEGKVIVQNPQQYYDAFTDEGITNRLADNRLPNVERRDRPLHALDLEPNSLDAVVAGMVFHDIYWASEDPDATISQLYAALKPGGRMLITDHDAPDGTGNEYALKFRDGIHRIEDEWVIETMKRHGFKLVGESDLLRHAEDDRTKPFFAPDMRGKLTDRFVLVFKKPGGKHHHHHKKGNKHGKAHKHKKKHKHEQE